MSYMTGKIFSANANIASRDSVAPTRYNRAEHISKFRDVIVCKFIIKGGAAKYRRLSRLYGSLFCLKP